MAALSLHIIFVYRILNDFLSLALFLVFCLFEQCSSYATHSLLYNQNNIMVMSLHNPLLRENLLIHNSANKAVIRVAPPYV